MNVNKVFIVGRVTADPQLRNTPTGVPVTSFGVATNRVWKDKSGTRQDETEFHNVVAWGRLAEIATQFLVKGSLVFIEGRLRTRSWTDKQNAQHRTTEVITEQLQLGPKPMGSGAPGRSAGETAGPAKVVSEEVPVIDLEDEIKAEDLPF